jgi:ribosomal-protein-alanine N-acetyltransferase
MRMHVAVPADQQGEAAAMRTVPHEAVKVHIRWMVRRDVPEVLELERSGFGEPWTAADIGAAMRSTGCIGTVAEHADRVVAHMVYRLHGKCIELLTLAVLPQYRRASIGTQLLARLASKLHPGRRNRITLQVHERNLPAQLFLRSCGYSAVCVDGEHYTMEYSVYADRKTDASGPSAHAS